MTNSSRYCRQTILPEIGKNGQNKLSNARVLCVGAGGLGCPALLYLAASGIGTIGIVDFDNIDISNLQRQILFTTGQQGQNKAETACAALIALNPEINVNAYTQELNADNVMQIFKNYDIVIDGTDNFAAKFLINDAAVKSRKPVVYGAILGFKGQLSVFDATQGPCYRCLYPAPPSGHIPNCAEAGVIGSLAGMVGAAQAMEAIKIAIGHSSLKPLIGRLLLINAKTMEQKIIKLPKDSRCPTCSGNSDSIKLTYESDVCTTIKIISMIEAKSMKGAIFIDVREDFEWQEGHMQGALLYPLSRIIEEPEHDIPDDRPCIIYCKKGLRAQKATKILTEKGFKNIFSLIDGYEIWGDN